MVPAFIAAYQGALVVSDLVTAAMLYQLCRLRQRPALMLLVSAYLFTGLMAGLHALTFPGLFCPTGCLGAGPQSTAWLYMFWHAGFPLYVLVYTKVNFTSQPAISSGAHRPSRVGLWAIGTLVLSLSCAALLALPAQAWLPPIMSGNRYSALMVGTVGTVWTLSGLALLNLARRAAQHSFLDSWLMVVMWAWIFDIALSAVFNAGRYDLGFYIGRLFGLMAGTYVVSSQGTHVDRRRAFGQMAGTQ